jgi:hypothetical protein
VLLSLLNYGRGAVNNHVPQITPIFLVMIDDQADVGVLSNIHDSPELGWFSSLGFLVD